MILSARNLNKSYNGKSVVKDVSLDLNQGEIVGLLGPNGAGKTTSFYMIVGLIKSNSGILSPGMTLKLREKLDPNAS